MHFHPLLRDYSVNKICLDTLPLTPWRNGAGQTREIVAYSQSDSSESFSWRASIATINQDCYFSLFPGVDRIITLLHGEGVTLTAPGWQQQLKHGESFSFRGEEKIYARLQGGISHDFNLMTCRKSHHASMSTITHEVQPPSHVAGIAYVLTGGWQCQRNPLSQGECVWWHHNGPALIPVTPDACLLFATIEKRHPDSPKRPTSL